MRKNRSSHSYISLLLAFLLLFVSALYILELTQQDTPPQVQVSLPAPISKPKEIEPQPYDGFVYLNEYAPEIVCEIRYATEYNFVGAPICGYEKPLAILSTPAAHALKQASDRLNALGYTIKIFDAYRPKSAVEHFAAWAADLDDDKMKSLFYPNVDKSALFSGYISDKSGHTRGSTVDITLIDRSSGKELDMGTPFDFLGEESGVNASLTDIQSGNRQILKTAMLDAGFKPYSKEWWHFTLKSEPYPDTYFNFPVK